MGRHVRTCARGPARSTPTEDKLVTAIAVAMWKEIRADRIEADVSRPPSPARRPHGSDCQEPATGLSLGTAIRYATAAGMATQRAQRAFLAHRKAKARRPDPARGRARECTNEFRHRPTLALYRAANDADPAQPQRTNEFPPGDFPLYAARSDRRHSNRSTETAATGRRAIWPTSTAVLR